MINTPLPRHLFGWQSGKCHTPSKYVAGGEQKSTSHLQCITFSSSYYSFRSCIFFTISTVLLASEENDMVAGKWESVATCLKFPRHTTLRVTI